MQLKYKDGEKFDNMTGAYLSEKNTTVLYSITTPESISDK